MGLNKEILNLAITGTAGVYLPANGMNKTSFQITHPNVGNVVVQASNSTAKVNYNNPIQMATIGWSDLRITQPDDTKVYVIDLADPMWASPCTIPFECLNYEFMNIFISGGLGGNYIIEQHINDLNPVHED